MAGVIRTIRRGIRLIITDITTPGIRLTITDIIVRITVRIITVVAGIAILIIMSLTSRRRTVQG